MVKLIVRSLGTVRARASVAVLAAAALASMAFASVAGATEPLVAPMVKSSTEEFTTNLPVILSFVGMIIAVGLVVNYFRTHAKKA